MALKILDVGQCGFDGPRMAALWRETLGAEVGDARTRDEALRQVKGGGYDVVLVNRVLAADGASGLDVIRDVLASGTGVPVMLVSDYAEAQDQAVELGALRGFGKSDLDDLATLQRVADAAASRDDE